MNDIYEIDKKILILIKENFYYFAVYCFYTIHHEVDFLENWHIEYLSDILNELMNENGERIIINLPPRHLKSELCSIIFPAWILAQKPAKRIIAVSYSMTLTCRYERDLKIIINSDWYKRIFPNTKIDKKNNRKNNFVTTKNGYYYATSINGTLTGEGGDFIIVDDPHNPVKIGDKNVILKTNEWFDKVLSTRCNSKKSSIVIIMQRVAKNDLTGYLLEKDLKWQHIKFPLLSIEEKEIIAKKKIYHFRKLNEPLHEKRMNIYDILLLKKQVTEDVFLTQYQQSPEFEEARIINVKNFQLFEEINFDKYYFSIDTASSLNIMADYTVILIFSFNKVNFYLIDILRGKFEYGTLKEKIIELIKQWNPIEILIENKGIGISLIQEIGKAYNIKGINPKISKEGRLYQVLHFIEQKRVFISSLLKNNKELIEEIEKFPRTKHDDQVDVIVQALQFFKEKIAFEIKENKAAKIRFI